MVRKQYIVTKSDAKQRLDKYLRKILPNAPQSFIYRLIRTKDVRVNGVKTAENYIIKEHDEVVLFLTEQQVENFISAYRFHYIKKPLSIIYEDENILVINKERGIPIHQTHNEKSFTLTNYVLTYLYDKKEFDPEKRGYVMSPVSRIDEQTTGIVVFAKKQSVHQALAKAFTSAESVERTYDLIVYGILNKDKGIIDLPLQKEGSKSLPNTSGKQAITTYTVKQIIDNYTRVEAKLITGRSNQIRAHFAALGYPVVGDTKYGLKTDKFPLMLNAHKLVFHALAEPLTYLNGKKFVANNKLKLKHEEKQ